MARYAFDADLAAEKLGELLANCEAKPGPAIFPRYRFVCLGEFCEQFRLRFRRDADACVGHGEAKLQLVVVESELGDIYRDAATFGELGRVADQVEQDLTNAGRVGPQDRGNIWGNLDGECQPLAW